MFINTLNDIVKLSTASSDNEILSKEKAKKFDLIKDVVINLNHNYFKRCECKLYNRKLDELGFSTNVLMQPCT